VILRSKDPNCQAAAAAHDLCNFVINIKVCINVELLKVEVPLMFSGTVGGCHTRRDVRLLF
jgi:hypothetical protein